MITYRFCACLVLLTSFALNLFSCGTPALHTGIRVRAELLDSVFQTPNTGAAVPGVHDTGIFLHTGSGQTNGSQEVIDDYTNSLGINDYPNAITGAYWNMGADFTNSAVPACGTGSNPGVFMAYPVSEQLWSCFPSPTVP